MFECSALTGTSDPAVSLLSGNVAFSRIALDKTPISEGGASCALVMEHRVGFILAAVRIELLHCDDFHYASLPGFSASDLHDNRDEATNFGLNRAVGHLSICLQGERRQARKSLVRAFGVNGAQRAGVPGVQRLQEVSSLRAAYLADENAIWPVPKRRLHQLANRDLLDAFLLAARLKPEDVRA